MEQTSRTCTDAPRLRRQGSGAKPSELQLQQPTKFDLVVNLTTAKAWCSLLQCVRTLLAQSGHAASVGSVSVYRKCGSLAYPLTPVTLPSGRPKLVTSPWSTGFAPVTKSRVKTAQLSLHFGPFAALDQVEESERARGEART